MPKDKIKISPLASMFMKAVLPSKPKKFESKWNMKDHIATIQRNAKPKGQRSNSISTLPMEAVASKRKTKKHSPAYHASKRRILNAINQRNNLLKGDKDGH